MSETEDNKLIAKRREKLAQLRAAGNPFPNTFRRTHLAADVLAEFDALERAELDDRAASVAVAGRVVALRGPFVVVQDMTGRLQLYVNRRSLPEHQSRQAPVLFRSDWSAIGGWHYRLKAQ